MNLAQLIPPEFAQEGCKPRHAIVRPADAPTPPLETRTVEARDDDEPAPEAPPSKARRNSVRRALLKGLSHYPAGVFTAATDLLHDIGDEKLNINTTCAVLYQALARGLVERKGANRRWKYALTAAGRKTLG